MTEYNTLKLNGVLERKTTIKRQSFLISCHISNWRFRYYVGVCPLSKQTMQAAGRAAKKE